MEATIVAIVLAHSTETLIEESLKSIKDHVDKILLIDTGVTDNTLQIAKKVVGLEKLVIRSWPWQNDYAVARNKGLELAKNFGNWGIFIDTDMRYINAELIRPALEDVGNEEVLYVTADAGHIQSLIFRLPSSVLWEGRVHEAVNKPGKRMTISNVRVREVPKTKEQLIKKFTYTRDLLLQESETPRTLYYLADCYEGLGESEKAIETFRRCSNLKGWNEESAWACFRAGRLLCKHLRWEEALEECGRGLTRHAGISELAWLAGYVSWAMGKIDQAIFWAKISLVWADKADVIGRIYFRDEQVLRTGPWDILRFALRAVNDERGAQEAEEAYQAAMLFVSSSLLPTVNVPFPEKPSRC